MKPLPCPFCESDRILTLPGARRLSGYCAQCGATGPRADTEEAAITAWNTRADPVRAALAVPGVAGLLDLIHGGFRDHDIAPATQRTLAALRVLADAAKEAGRG